MLAVFKLNAPSPHCSIAHHTFAINYVIRLDQWLLIANTTGPHIKFNAWFDSDHGCIKDELPSELNDLRRTEA